MSTYHDLTGKKFGRLIVILDNNTKRKDSKYVLCRCECGNEKWIASSSLISGYTKSCGCLNKEKASERAKERSTIHGMSNKRIHKIWWGMIARCTYPSVNEYNNYGGRGIKVCDEWLTDFMSFYNWAMLHGYADNLSIDRINVNGNYEPSNCRWVTMQKQQNNKRSNNFITYNGITKTASEWSYSLGGKRMMVTKRLQHGWTLEKALTVSCDISYRQEKAGVRHSITYNGVTKSAARWAHELGGNARLIMKRLSLGWSIEDALTKPVDAKPIKNITFNGVTKTLSDWSRGLGGDVHLVSKRLAKGMDIEKALTMPVNIEKRHNLRKEGI
jgi:hypothetical protein